MASFLDACRFIPTAGGTADWTYSSAVGGYQSPSAAGVVNGATYRYRVESSDLTQWEIGTGTYNTGTGVLTRATVLFNSSGTGTGAGQTGAGTKINFTLVPQVAVVYLAEDIAAPGQLPGTATNDNASAGNVGEYTSTSTGQTTATVTISIASPGVITWTAHGLQNTTNDGNIAAAVFFTTTGALPTGLTASTPYYVIGSSIATNTFQVATSVANALAGTAVNTSGTQSGTQTGHFGAIIVTTSTTTDVTGLSLTAGDWEVLGSISIQPQTSAQQTLLEAYISTSSNTRAPSPAGGSYFFDQQSKTSGTSQANFIGRRRMSLTSTTTVYLGAFMQFTGGTGMSVAGYLGARRVR